jgi:hypothetical protein
MDLVRFGRKAVQAAHVERSPRGLGFTCGRGRPLSVRLPLSLVWLLLLCFRSHAASAETPGPHSSAGGRDVSRIQRIVDDYIARIAMRDVVRVSVVPKNGLMVSVTSLDDDGSAFQLSFDKDFLDQLTEDELRAAIAHELGHVWIFTHHPFLQTEALANDIAMRVVAREHLVPVYEKVWRRLGTKGDLARFVSQ